MPIALWVLKCLVPVLRTICLPILLALVTMAATCDGPDPIDLDDRNRFTPSGRASYEVLPGNAQRRRGALLDVVSGRAPASTRGPDGRRVHRVQGTFSIDGELAHTTGHDRPTVEFDQEVKLPDGPTTSGPAEIDLDTEAFYGHVAGRGGIRIIDMFSIEGLVGVGLNRTELRLKEFGVSSSEDGGIRPGFLIGARTTFRPIPLFDLYAQATLLAMDTDVSARDLQVGVDLNLTSNVAVFAGHHWYRFMEDHNSASNVRINLNGPVAGVALKF